MARFNQHKNSFLGGELSPKALARDDLPNFQQGAKKLKNAWVQGPGGATRRPGTQFAADISDTSTVIDKDRVFPFIFSEVDAAAIVAGFPNLGGSGTPATVAISNFLAGINDLSDEDGDGVVDSDADTKRTPGAAMALSASTTTYPIVASDRREIHYAQKGDLLFLAHPDMRPVVIRRYATQPGAFTFDMWYWGEGATGDAQCTVWPYVRNTGSITFQLNNGSVGTGWVVTASSAYFLPQHVGTIFKVNGHNEAGTPVYSTGYFRVTAVTSSPGVFPYGYAPQTTATVDILKTVPASAVVGGSSGSVTDWEEQAWSDVRGWPNTVAIWQGRLFFAGTEADPDGLWGSQQDDFFEFMSRKFMDDSNFSTTSSNQTAAEGGFKNGVQNTDPVAFFISGGRVSQVRALIGADTLVIGSTTGIYRGMAASQELGFGPMNYTFPLVSGYGAARVQPVLAGDVVVYVGSDGRSVRVVPKMGEQESESHELTRLADHMCNNDERSPTKIVQMEYQPTGGRVWCLTDDGFLHGCTLDRNVGVSAWHQHELGGPSQNIKSIACIPNEDGTHWDLWMVVERTIPGWSPSPTTRRSLEILGEEFLFPVLDHNGVAIAPQKSAFGLDCARYLSELTPQTNWSDMGMYWGQEVGIFADGLYLGTRTMDTDNILELDVACSSLIVGFPYEHVIVPTAFTEGSPLSSSKGRIKRIDEVAVQLYRSAALNVGASEDEQEPVDLRDPEASADDIPQLFSGVKVIQLRQDYERECEVVIAGSDPYPLTVLSVAGRGMENDG